MTATRTTRREILDGIKTALSAAFNATSGTTLKLFRSVYRGPVHPVVTGRPVLGIHDGGQRRQDDGDTGDSGERLLTVQLTLHLAANWMSVPATDDWTDNVEEIIRFLEDKDTVGAGIITLNYVSDDPVDLVWADGSVEAAWTIEFEANRFVDY